MGPLIGPNAAPWYDFCHIKNLTFPPSPINRTQFRDEKVRSYLEAEDPAPPTHMLWISLVLLHKLGRAEILIWRSVLKGAAKNFKKRTRINQF